MHKLHIFGLIGLAAIIIGLAWAEEITFTTYYPAPYGVYNDMRVMNSLGVGTTAPSERLDVVGGQVRVLDIDWNDSQDLRIEDWIREGARGLLVSEDTDHIFVGLRHYSSNRSDAVIEWGDDPKDVGTDPAVEDSLLFVHKLFNGGEFERMRIDSAGNVGIGTTDPTTKLEVQREDGGFLIGKFKNVATSGDRTALIDIETGDGEWWRYGVGGTENNVNLPDGQFYIERRTVTPDVKLVIDTAGKVGIGTVTFDGRVPEGSLQVNDATAGGSIYIKGAKESGGGYPVDGTGISNALVFSDRTGVLDHDYFAIFSQKNIGGGSFIEPGSPSATDCLVFSLMNHYIAGGKDGFVFGATMTTSSPPTFEVALAIEAVTKDVRVGHDLYVENEIYYRGGQQVPDYVFDPEYKLESIAEHAEFMWEHKRLPGIVQPQKRADGKILINAGADRTGILEELEKAHIYIAQLKEMLDKQERRIAALENSQGQKN